LVRVGAYQRGADLVLDCALAALPAINAFLRQEKNERTTFQQAQQMLMSLPDGPSR
jgi:flagellum-specific ATP synthase